MSNRVFFFSNLLSRDFLLQHPRARPHGLVLVVVEGVGDAAAAVLAAAAALLDDGDVGAAVPDVAVPVGDGDGGDGLVDRVAGGGLALVLLFDLKGWN